MAFFDDLGKKISQAGQSAVQKTKDMTDTARINGAIAEEEKKINHYYFQIGKLYVATHATDYENDFAGMINAVQDSKKKIREYYQQLQDIKGVICCTKCGNEMASEASFCSVCGSPMPRQTVQANPNMVKCVGCGAMISKDNRFCTSCGKPMADSVPTQSWEQPAVATVQVAPQPVIRRCPNCNFVVEEDLVFCTECGTKL